MEPTVGRIVHYVSHGTPVLLDGTQTYESVCRAAIVTGVGDNYVSLTVFSPEGAWFGRSQFSTEHDGGSWHWPERA